MYDLIISLGPADLVQYKLLSNHGETPRLSQIQAYAKNRKKTRRLISEIDAICKSLLRDVNDPSLQEDEAFVVDYHVTAIDDFCIVLSTKRLLRIFGLTARRSIDGTYKLLKSGYPVLVMGVDDADRHYHPVIIALSATEQGAAFHCR